MIIEEGKNHTVWTVEEILTMRALQAEGNAMKHCVSSYWYNIVNGGTSIWSLQKNGVRMLTIEVNNPSWTVVQARGKCNAPPTPKEKLIMMKWASKNRVRLRML